MVDRVFPDWLNPLVEHGHIAHFSENDVIFSQGDDLTEVGFVLTGRAKAVAYSLNGDETWLCEFTTGDLIGHLELLNEEPLLHELTTETDMSILFLPVSVVKAHIETSASVGTAVANDLAHRLKVMMDRYLEALTLSAKGRVCAELIRLAHPIGVQPDYLIVRPNPVFVELAIRINSTRETVSRTVSELQKKGILVRETGALIVQKPSALKAAMK